MILLTLSPRPSRLPEAEQLSSLHRTSFPRPHLPTYSPLSNQSTHPHPPPPPPQPPGSLSAPCPPPPWSWRWRCSWRRRFSCRRLSGTSWARRCVCVWGGGGGVGGWSWAGGWVGGEGGGCSCGRRAVFTGSCLNRKPIKPTHMLIPNQKPPPPPTHRSAASCAPCWPR